MLVCVFSHRFAHETAGAARTRHSPRPLVKEGGKRKAKLGRIGPRDRELMSISVIARSPCDDLSAVARRAKAEAIHLAAKRKNGLPRRCAPRNDVVGPVSASCPLPAEGELSILWLSVAGGAGAME